MAKNTKITNGCFKLIKLAHLIGTNFFGGPEKQIIEHLKLIDKNCFKPYAISYKEKGQPNDFLIKAKESNINFFAIPMSNPFDITALIELIRFIKKNEIQLLCVHGYKSCVIGYLAAKFYNIPILAFSRGYTHENLKISIYQWIERRFLDFMDGIVAVSKGQFNILKNKYNIKNSNIWVVRNAVSTASTCANSKSSINRQATLESLGLDNYSRIIVSAGRLSPEKGHRFFLEAIANLKHIDNNTFFIICGDGPIKTDLINQAKNLKLEKKIIFAGFRNDLDRIFDIMDFLVLPSLTEGLPNVVLEAFAAKKTVVATAVGGVPEVIDDGLNGFLCPSGDPLMLAQAIDKALNNIDDLAEFGLRGYRKVQTMFSFEQQNQSLERIYQGLISHYYHEQ